MDPQLLDYARASNWDFPKIRVPYFGILIIRILLFRVLLIRILLFRVLIIRILLFWGPCNKDPTI